MRRVPPNKAPGYGYPLVVIEVDKPGTCHDCGPDSKCPNLLLEVAAGPDDGYRFRAGQCHFKVDD